MKKNTKIIIFSSILLLIILIVSTYLIIIKTSNTKKENLYIDISDYKGKPEGSYITKIDEQLYIIVLYKAKDNGSVKDLKVEIKKENEVVETIKTNSNTRKLKKDEIGYFVGKINKIEEFDEKYNLVIIDNFIYDDSSNRHIINGEDITNYINDRVNLLGIDNGLIICSYENKTKKDVKVKNCTISLMNKNNEIVEEIITVPEKEIVKPGEKVYFAGHSKKYVTDRENVSLNESPFIVNFK